MSRARRRRYSLRWNRYQARYITPANGGLVDVADSIAAAKASFRAMGAPWRSEYARNWRWSRSARRPPKVQR